MADQDPPAQSKRRFAAAEGGLRAVVLTFVVRALLVLGAMLALLPFAALARGLVTAIQGGTAHNHADGVTLALVALLLGSVFFAYSVRYYLATLVMLLSSLVFSSSNGTRNGNGHDAGNGHPKGLLRLLRRGGGNGNGNGNGNGHGNWNGNFDLGYEPFVSIHIATYNEKRVIERLLEGCAALEYGSYEVIVVDDSTDGTEAILANWLERPRFKIVHRENRHGYKGGALAVALQRMDPRTEFVIVWDADVMPFPDSIRTFLPHFFKAGGNGGSSAPAPRPEVGAVQSYQWHILNKSESWLTEGVRAEYAGSYMVERPFQEVIGSLKMIAGTAYMIRAPLLRELGWGHSLTEDWELTLRLHTRGYKVVYTPYAESPAECVATFGRLARQRMRWAEGHSYNVRRWFGEIVRSPHLSAIEKVEFLYYSTYYLQAALFIVGSAAWLVSELVLHAAVPDWTAVLGWSLLVSNMLSLPIMNFAGLLLEGAPAKDFVGVLGALATSFLLVPFQAYAAVKGLLERDEGPWFRTPKTGHVTDPVRHLRRLKWIGRWLGPGHAGRSGAARGGYAATALPPPPAARSLGWIVVGALVLAVGGIGVAGLHAPVAEAAGTNLYLHGANAYTLDTTIPSGAVQTLNMTAAGASRTWATTTATLAAQTISSSTAFTFNYWTAAAPAGTASATLTLAYSASRTCGVIAYGQVGPEVAVASGNVTPSLPAATSAGDLLVATIAATPGNAVNAPANTPGWTLAARISVGPPVGSVEIWYRANSTAGEPSPNFTSTNTNIDVQESEWAGAAAVPLDRTGTKTQPVAVNSTTIPTSAATTGSGDLGITDFQVTSGTFASGAGWSTLIHDGARGYASDYQLGLPASVVSETMGLSASSIWADAIATFMPAAATLTTIAQTTATLTNGQGLSTSSFSPTSNVTVPAGSYLCFSVAINSVTGGGLVLDYDAASTPSNLGSSQTIFIPELVLPFIGLTLLAPLAGRVRRRRVS